MSEREVASVVPALSPFKGPGIAKGEPSDKIYLVTYTDGSVAYRCVTCSKEFPTFHGTWGHITHHGRTPESYKHDGRSLPKSKKINTSTIESIVKRILTESINDTAKDVSDALTGVSESAVTELQQELDSIRAKYDEERGRRVRAEKDLAKIKNLFK